MNAGAGTLAALVVAAAGGAAAAGWAHAGAGATPGAQDILGRVAGFTAQDFAAIDAGQPIVKVLDTDRREVAVAGAIRINGRRDQLADRMRDVQNLKRSDIVLAVGVFSRPPRPEDLQSLPFEDYDLDVRACRPGDCKVRLSAEHIARFQREVDWGSPLWRAQSAAVWRGVITECAADYWTHGASALTRYDNKRDSLSVRQEYGTLLGESAFIASLAPELYAYLQDASPARLENAEDLMYWSKEDFSVRPVTRITHQTIYRPRRASGIPPVLIATKQIYGTHYIDAALGLTLALDAPPASPSSAFYMVVVNRARTRSLSGFFRGMVRSVVQNRSRTALEKILRSTKTSLESRP